MGMSNSINPGGGFSPSEATTWARDTGLPILPTYLGQVATRSLMPNNIASGFRSANGQTFHIARDNINALQVAYANWLTTGGFVEVGSGGTLTISASIQYPIAANPAAGAWQTFSWSGNPTTGAIADGNTSALSDVLTLAAKIPAGAGFLLRWHAEASVQIPFWQMTASNNAAYNQVAGASVTPAAFADKTTGGAVASGTSANNVYPILIVGQTNRPSCFLFGDSRCWGTGDTFDASGNTGELARGLGEHYGYVNLGRPSETLQNWLTNSTKRRSLLPYFSHVVGNMSINDIAASRTVAQLSADIAAAAALCKGDSNRKVMWATMSPSSTSTNAWTGAGGTGQTVSGANAARTGVNDLLRSRQIAGVDGVFDIASAMETAPNSGLWDIDGGGALTADGLHCNWRGYQRIKRSRVVDLLG